MYQMTNGHLSVTVSLKYFVNLRLKYFVNLRLKYFVNLRLTVVHIYSSIDMYKMTNDCR